MSEIVKPPARYNAKGKYVVFLAGTIDQGRGENWQKRVEEKLSGFGDWLLILNPRRDDWDSSWEQTIENKEFKNQVTWELNGQEAADMVMFVFATDEENAKEAKAPITLLELGLFRNKECVVVCPKTFYRKGNVDIVCERYGIPVYEDLDTMLDDLVQTIAASEPGS
jgi:hypothetical protein